MAASFSHPLSKNQSQALAVLYAAAEAAQAKAQAYFQGVVDGIPVPEGDEYSFRLSEDATTVICIPKAPDAPPAAPTPDAPPSAE